MTSKRLLERVSLGQAPRQSSGPLYYFGPEARIVGLDRDPSCARFDGAFGHVRIGDQADAGFLAPRVSAVTHSLSFYDSMIAFEKRQRPEPWHELR